MLVARGTITLRRSNRFPASSEAMLVSPVVFPPGRTRLATSPLPTGSAITVMTTGIVWLRRRTARIASVSPEMMMSTGSPTSSAARSGSRSIFPSAQRYSIAMFRPSS